MNDYRCGKKAEYLQCLRFNGSIFKKNTAKIGVFLAVSDSG
jgi:hypothetical protein